MATKIEISDLSNTNFVDSTSRYINSRILLYGDKKIVTFETYKRSTIRSSPDDRFMVIHKGIEFRPDLLANRVYGITSFWWKILEANNMKDVFEFKSGVNIRIPSTVF
jgi:hypothetical protein